MNGASDLAIPRLDDVSRDGGPFTSALCLSLALSPLVSTPGPVAGIKSRATPRTMPVWDGRPESAIAYLHAEEAWRKAAQLATWRENGVSEDEISRIAPQRLAELTAIYEARRTETARLNGDT